MANNWRMADFMSAAPSRDRIYHSGVSARDLTTADLIALLDRLPLPLVGSAGADVDHRRPEPGLERIAVLADALRRAVWTDTSRLAARLLLADIALLASDLRGDARKLSDGLTDAANGLAACLAWTAPRLAEPESSATDGQRSS
jgi:hypothetical protein